MSTVASDLATSALYTGIARGDSLRVGRSAGLAAVSFGMGDRGCNGLERVIHVVRTRVSKGPQQLPDVAPVSCSEGARRARIRVAIHAVRTWE